MSRAGSSRGVRLGPEPCNSNSNSKQATIESHAKHGDADIEH